MFAGKLPSTATARKLRVQHPDRSIETYRKREAVPPSKSYGTKRAIVGAYRSNWVSVFQLGWFRELNLGDQSARLAMSGLAFGGGWFRSSGTKP